MKILQLHDFSSQTFFSRNLKMSKHLVVDGTVTVRNPDQFPEHLRRVLDIVTINETPNVVGSAAYSNHKYPSDVDVFEQVTTYGTLDEATDFFSKRFRDIIRKVLVDSSIHFSDFKAGEDRVFFLPPDTPPKVCRARIRELYWKGYLSKEEAQRLLDVSDDPPEFFDKLREFRVLRWTPDEILLEKKLLRSPVIRDSNRKIIGIEDRVLTLSDALKNPTVTKLDVVSWIAGRFQPVEVFYDLRYTPISTAAPISLYPLNSYVESLLQDIEKYGSVRNYQPLKLIKRLWILSRITNCRDMVEALNPILGSDAAALNQIVSDIETLWHLIELPVPGVVPGSLRSDVKTSESKWLSNVDIQNIYLEVLGFGKRWNNHHGAARFDNDLQDVFWSWYHWSKTGIFNRELLEQYFNKWDIDLTKRIRLLSETFYQAILKMNITCTNPRFSNMRGASAKEDEA
jgi:hypothetical protein